MHSVPYCRPYPNRPGSRLATSQPGSVSTRLEARAPSKPMEQLALGARTSARDTMTGACAPFAGMPRTPKQYALTLVLPFMRRTSTVTPPKTPATWILTRLGFSASVSSLD